MRESMRAAAGPSIRSSADMFNIFVLTFVAFSTPHFFSVQRAVRWSSPAPRPSGRSSQGWRARRPPPTAGAPPRFGSAWSCRPARAVSCSRSCCSGGPARGLARGRLRLRSKTMAILSHGYARVEHSYEELYRILRLSGSVKTRPVYGGTPARVEHTIEALLRFAQPTPQSSSQPLTAMHELRLSAFSTEPFNGARPPPRGQSDATPSPSVWRPGRQTHARSSWQPCAFVPGTLCDRQSAAVFKS